MNRTEEAGAASGKEAAGEDYIHQFLPPITVTAAQAALLVIDLQYATASWDRGLGALCVHRDEKDLVEWRLNRVDDLVIPNVRRLAEFCRRASVRVIYITSGSQTGDFADVAWNMRNMAMAVGNAAGSPAHEIRQEVRPEPGDIVLNKTTQSAFSSSGIDAVLRALGVTYVICVGVSTNMCVEGTARDAAERSYRPVVVEDACSAARSEYHDNALITLRRLGVHVVTTRDLLAEMADGVTEAREHLSDEVKI